jgi:hypothetical protein
MPTPFVVAYEENVPDSQLAERLVHEELTQLGFRVTDSREFFTIPLKSAIQIVSRVAQVVRSLTTGEHEIFNVADDAAELTGEYYFEKGLEALTGGENTLQDFSVARGCFERAIELGNVSAYRELAYMYMSEQGVRQSLEKALQLLKIGGDKGDLSCYAWMWRIYAGKTIFDAKHEANAEVCFQWILNSAREEDEEILAAALYDYLNHAYDQLDDYGTKFAIERFPGKFFSSVLDQVGKRVKHVFDNVHHARLAGLPLDLALDHSRPSAPSYGDVVMLDFFLTRSIQDSQRLSFMRKVMADFDMNDLEYVFSNDSGSLNRYLQYIPSKNAATKTESLAEPADQKPHGVFSRFFSYFFSQK